MRDKKKLDLGGTLEKDGVTIMANDPRQKNPQPLFSLVSVAEVPHYLTQRDDTYDVMIEALASSPKGFYKLERAGKTAHVMVNSLQGVIKRMEIKNVRTMLRKDVLYAEVT